MAIDKHEKKVIGVFRIGNGQTLHPAVKDMNCGGWVTLLCGCPNTCNGFGANNGRFFEGVSPACKRSKRIYG